MFIPSPIKENMWPNTTVSAFGPEPQHSALGDFSAAVAQSAFLANRNDQYDLLNTCYWLHSLSVVGW